MSDDRDLFPDTREVARQRRHLRILRFIANQCDKWGMGPDLEIPEARRRSGLRIVQLVGRRPEARATLSELLGFGVIREHLVNDASGKFWFRYYDITEKGRRYQQALAARVGPINRLLRESAEALEREGL